MMVRTLKKRPRNRYYPDRVHTREIPLKDGKRDTIVQWIYDIRIVEWYTTFLLQRDIDALDVEDKIQEIYYMICSIPQEKWDELYEQGRYSISAYVTGIVHQQIVSSTSRIYYGYNRYREIVSTMDDLFWETYYDEH